MRSTAAVFIILTLFACATQGHWERAKLWVVRHSHFKIQLANDMMIRSYKEPSDRQSHAFTIMKEPVSGAA